MTADEHDPLDDLHRDAYAAMDRGSLAEALPLFQRLVHAKPGDTGYQYMLGLVHKYRREWPECIEHNLLSIAAAADEEGIEAERWNIAIAASAIGDWQLAREHWIAAGIALEPGTAPMDEDRGIVSVRLNPWGSGETLFAERIGIARARLSNIPLPDSGHRYGDLVLIDGAKTGERRYGNATVPVFNALQRLVPSEFLTYEVRLDCATPADADALESAAGDGIGAVEDWSRSMTYFCAKCSYGAPHEHAEREPDATGWVRERHFGMAALSPGSVDLLLEAWLKAGREGPFLSRLARRRPRRAVLEIIEADCPEQPLTDAGPWWREP